MSPEHITPDGVVQDVVIGFATVLLGLLSVYIICLLLIQYYLKREPKALLRFIHMLGSLDSDPIIQSTDYLARLFTNNTDRYLCSFSLFRKLIIYYLESTLPGLYYEVLARDHLWSQEIKQLLQRRQVAGQPGGFKQLVILQAGDDTQAYRLTSLFRSSDIKVFEVDLENVLTQKRARLGMEKHAMPSYVYDIYCDLEAETGELQTALTRSKFDPKLHTVWLWQGVFHERSSKLVNEVMSVINELSPYGSCLCFDFFTGSPATLDEEYGGEEIISYLEKYEKRLNGLFIDVDEGLAELDRFLKERSLSLLHYFGPEQLALRLHGKGQMSGYVAFAIAEVTSGVIGQQGLDRHDVEALPHDKTNKSKKKKNKDREREKEKSSKKKKSRSKSPSTMLDESGDSIEKKKKKKEKKDKKSKDKKKDREKQKESEEIAKSE